MKKIKLLSLVSTALVGLAQPTWAGPHGGGGGFGGGGFAGGGHPGGGGHFGGGSRAAPAFSGGGFRGAPAFRGSGAYFTGRSVGAVSRAPHFYYGGTRMSAIRTHGFAGSVGRSVTPSAGRRTAITRQSNRVGSIAGRNRASDPRISRATNRGSFNTNHAFARHDANWHRDWDRRHAHFHNGNVFVFISGFWYGFYPWDYYGYGSYPYDYYGYPYDYYNSGYPDDYYNQYPDNYNDQPAYGDSDPYANNVTVSAVQSELAKLGYYNGAIDGALGDQTEAAIAHYQEDHDLSVTGTLTAATLQSLGLTAG